MKAAVVEKTGELRVRNLPEPEIGPYDALCEILFGAVCTGTDSHLLHQRPPFCHWVKLPFILGHESVGRVIKTGAKVRNYQAGDLVTRVGCPPVGDVNIGWGGFAEKGIAKDWEAMQQDGLSEKEWKSATVNRVLPAGTDPAAATMFITWRENYSYSVRLGIGQGARVAVVGSGGNGLSFANQAVNLGASQVVLIGSKNRESVAKAVGCAGFVDYKAEDAKKQALALSPAGYDFVIDAIGKNDTANLALSLVANNGKLGVYGMDGAGQIHLAHNGSFGSFTIYRGGYDEGEAHEDVLRYFQQGKLDASNWLNLENPFPLDKIQDAFAAVTAREIVKPLIRICG